MVSAKRDFRTYVSEISYLGGCIELYPSIILPVMDPVKTFLSENMTVNFVALGVSPGKFSMQTRIFKLINSTDVFVSKAANSTVFQGYTSKLYAYHHEVKISFSIFVDNIFLRNILIHKHQISHKFGQRFSIIDCYHVALVPFQRWIKGRAKEARAQGRPPKRGPHHVYVFSQMYDMCVPRSHFY